MQVGTKVGQISVAHVRSDVILGMALQTWTQPGKRGDKRRHARSVRSYDISSFPSDFRITRVRPKTQSPANHPRVRVPFWPIISASTAVPAFPSCGGYVPLLGQFSNAMVLSHVPRYLESSPVSPPSGPVSLFRHFRPSPPVIVDAWLLSMPPVVNLFRGLLHSLKPVTTIENNQLSGTRRFAWETDVEP